MNSGSDRERPWDILASVMREAALGSAWETAAPRFFGEQPPNVFLRCGCKCPSLEVRSASGLAEHRRAGGTCGAERVGAAHEKLSDGKFWRAASGRRERDARADGNASAAQGQSGRGLPQRPPHLGGRLRPRLRPEDVAEGSGHTGPLTLGHETVGEVVAAGPEAPAVRPGQVRLIYPWIGCRSCAVCVCGDENLCAKPRFLGVYCDGGYSDHITVPHPKYLIELDGLDPVSAAPYACSGVRLWRVAEAFRRVSGGADRSYRRRRPRLDVPVHPEGARRQGRGRGRHRRAQAPRGPRMRGARRRGRPGSAGDHRVARAAEGPVRGVVDLVGSPETAALGFDLLPKGGKLVIVGLFGAAHLGRCRSSR